MPLVLGGGAKCIACAKTVYKVVQVSSTHYFTVFKAEEKISEAGVFHKACFRCIACKKVKKRVKNIISAFIPIYLYEACIVIYFPIIFILIFLSIK